MSSTRFDLTPQFTRKTTGCVVKHVLIPPYNSCMGLQLDMFKMLKKFSLLVVQLLITPESAGTTLKGPIL